MSKTSVFYKLSTFLSILSETKIIQQRDLERGFEVLDHLGSKSSTGKCFQFQLTYTANFYQMKTTGTGNCGIPAIFEGISYYISWAN